MVEPENDKLRNLAIEFAILVSDICENIKGCGTYTGQAIRSSSSVGANLYEGKYAQSRSDFIHKFEIALKECYETEYWIELLYRKSRIDKAQYDEILSKCGKIRRIIIASVTTAKRSSPR